MAHASRIGSFYDYLGLSKRARELMRIGSERHNAVWRLQSDIIICKRPSPLFQLDYET